MGLTTVASGTFHSSGGIYHRSWGLTTKAAGTNHRDREINHSTVAAGTYYSCHGDLLQKSGRLTTVARGFTTKSEGTYHSSRGDSPMKPEGLTTEAEGYHSYRGHFTQ